MEAIPKIETHFDGNRGRIRWEFDSSRETAIYYGSSDRIVFGSTYDNIWTAAHGFGHGLHHKALGGLWTTHNCNPHEIDQGSSYTLLRSRKVSPTTPEASGEAPPITTGSIGTTRTAPTTKPRSKATSPRCSST